MLTDEQEKRIESLYIVYQKDIKPLTFYVERKYHKFPKALLKEFRDIFDHISRCYEKDATEQYKEENIKKAENHFDRIKLDTYKYVSDYKRREFSKWKRKYSKYDMQGINNGDFWKEVLSLEDEGERIFTLARSIEAKDVTGACDLLQESTMKYDKIDDLINNDKNREEIIKAKIKYTRVSVLNWLIGFVVGVIASVIATWIWECIIHRSVSIDNIGAFIRHIGYI